MLSHLDPYIRSILLLQMIHAAVEHNAKAISPQPPAPPSSSLQFPSEPTPLLIFKKPRPPPKLASWAIEDPPTLDDDQVAAAARWPSNFNDVDLQQVVHRLKDQIMNACLKCQDACFETRKSVANLGSAPIEQLEFIGAAN
jgi:hypothetical protein